MFGLCKRFKCCFKNGLVLGCRVVFGQACVRWLGLFYMHLVLCLFYARCLITGLFCLFYICLSVLAVLSLKLSAIETLLFFEGFLLLFSFCLIICVGLKPARVYYYIKNLWRLCL